MPNYRGNSVPYQTYRQMQTMPMPERPIWENRSLAMAYVPWQNWCDLYDPEKGFQCGTIFKELNKPFLGKGGLKR